VPLAPLLEHLGYTLTPTGGYNDKLDAHGKRILIKAHYWRCPDDDSAGNTIDFLVKVHGLTFAKAMQLITSYKPDTSVQLAPP
jgi:hypothetical protein